MLVVSAVGVMLLVVGKSYSYVGSTWVHTMFKRRMCPSILYFALLKLAISPKVGNSDAQYLVFTEITATEKATNYNVTVEWLRSC